MKNTISMNVSAIGTDDGKSTFEVQRTWNEKGKKKQSWMRVRTHCFLQKDSKKRPSERKRRMREFWMRLMSAVVIVGLILGYNSVLEARAKDEEIAKLNAKIENTESLENEDSKNGSYKDGTYTGEADGFGGTVKVEVIVKKQKIKEVNIVSADGEDGSYLTMAKDIIPKILDAQSAEVDTISGATFSSTGIKNATKQALEKAVK